MVIPPKKYKAVLYHRSSLTRLQFGFPKITGKLKMKKLRNHSQLKDQESSPKAVNNEMDLGSLTDFEFKREIVKILKELEKYTDSFRKELENIRRSHEKLENSCAEMQTELKALKSRMNDAEKLVTWKTE